MISLKVMKELYAKIYLFVNKAVLLHMLQKIRAIFGAAQI